MIARWGHCTRGHGRRWPRREKGATATPRNSLNDAIDALKGSTEEGGEGEEKKGEQRGRIFIRKIDSLVTKRWPARLNPRLRLFRGHCTGRCDKDSIFLVKSNGFVRGLRVKSR